MYKPIRDYAIIGNLRSAVLVSKDASIDWAPAPFIDSPSIFGAILDDEKGGFWQIAPAEEFKSSQYYDGDSNVVVTHFETTNFIFDVIDFIPIEKEKSFVPAEEDTTFKIHRKIVCKAGICRVRVVFKPRFDYARGETDLIKIEGGIFAKNGERHGVLETQIPFTIQDHTAEAIIELGKGEQRFFIFRYNTGEVILHEDEKIHHEDELRMTKEFWEEWVHRCDLASCPVAGKWHKEVVRSSLLLKILFFEPVGTIAAAPTTSLPESIGGVRNWDYRFTWIRDSAFTLMALFRLGYLVEAAGYVRWIVEICQDKIKENPEHLQAMYSLQGGKVLDEEILDSLSGYRNSRPVRIGNNAYKQKQWDIYGSILNMFWMIHKLRTEDHILNKNTWEILRSFANYVLKIWKEPDEGLWEIRTEKRHFVYSKVMCWVALDRALKISEAHNLEGERELWFKEKEKIYNDVMENGWSEEKQSFLQSYNSDAVDASALTFGTLGFIPGDHPKMISTIKRVVEELGVDEILLKRYSSPDGLPGEEGAFLLASFWLVDALILAKQKDKAEKIFEQLIGLKNHVGLFSEEMNPKTKEFLGNFPQAYTHIGLINSAFNLAEA